MTAKLTPFVFPSTGVQIALRPVNRFVIKELNEAIPMPTPPMEEIENPDGSKRLEGNTAHPDYLRAVNERTMKLEELIFETVVDLAVAYALTDEDKEKVAAHRNRMKRKANKEFDVSDLVLFIRVIAMGDETTEYQALLEAVISRGQPSDPK